MLWVSPSHIKKNFLLPKIIGFKHINYFEIGVIIILQDYTQKQTVFIQKYPKRKFKQCPINKMCPEFHFVHKTP
jgi:hypothetical protein